LHHEGQYVHPSIWRGLTKVDTHNVEVKLSELFRFPPSSIIAQLMTVGLQWDSDSDIVQAIP